MSGGWALLVSLFLLLGNAFFVGAEFAAMAVRRSSLEPLADAGSRRALACLGALERLGSLLATAQLGITVCSVGLGALAEAALEHLLEPVFHGWGLPGAWASGVALALALLLVSYLHVVVGEMIPKNIAIAGPERMALLLVPPLHAITNFFRPVVRGMEAVAKGLVRLLGIEPKDEIASTFTAEEVAQIVGESRREGLIEEERHGLVAKTLEFSDKLARDVAVGVDHLTCVGLGATPADIERLVARHGFSRYPVTDAAGEVAGYLHLKDVLYADDERHDVPIPPKRIRRLATVREEDEVEDVLATMQLTGAHLARVIDADGRVTGVVFLEDVLEELVGEVTDTSQR
ncbi:MAG TPA: hemolysin family protein [Intrasporangium sp.]|uniref:hemolysin family protein n=1 Tax=Intrasporangium sp. TaxID=1925024 RepID=UPI002D77E4BA|nr:hemolysin family protein [Intrasporangium sp.]HET7399974.1 hemolysin family protein [Intrasporangium sp.]